MLKHLSDALDATPLTAALVAAWLLMTPGSQALAASYSVDPVVSSITFSGTHADNPFSGIFERYAIDVDFDPADVAATRIRVTIDLASAKTGNKMFDGTLPGDDWFDVKNTPNALFKSTAVSKQADGSYSVTGDLTLRGITRPVTFTFILDREDAPEINASATLNIDRLDYGIGAKSDDKAEWVSREIGLTLKLVAKKK